MFDIIIYILIILLGIFLVRKNYFPKKLLKKLPTLQMISLYTLLATMGYKIGADESLIRNLHVLGMKAFIITFFAIIFSIISVKIFYWRYKK